MNMANYEPSREFSFLHVNLDNSMMAFENSKGTHVCLDPKNVPEHVDQARRVWNLVTFDMGRSNLPVHFTLKDGTYQMYKSGWRYEIRQIRPRTEWIRLVARPMTTHHVKHMIENNCSMEETINVLKVSPSTIKSWVVRRSWEIGQISKNDSSA
jgi:hypothetical protein